MAALALLGAAAIAGGRLFDRLPSPYPRDDFWYTSPSYVLIRGGLVVMTLGVAYAWNLMPWSAWPSPLRQLGRTSLLVYWVHIEVVYGGIVAPFARGKLGIEGASIGLLLLTLAMVLLSLARTQGLPWRRPRGQTPPPTAPSGPFDRPVHGA